MARTHFWHFLQNEEGQPVEGASIYVYLAATTTPAYVYLQESGGDSTDVAPQVTTDVNGYFEFWIADATETHGYTGQKFKLRWSKPGVIDDGYVDFVEVSLPAREVDETDTDETKNKMVSNNLARLWSAKTGKMPFEIVAGTGPGGWVDDGGGNYYKTLTHDLENSYPLVMVYDHDILMTTLSFIAESVNPSAVRIWVTEAKHVHVMVIG